MKRLLLFVILTAFIFNSLGPLPSVEAYELPLPVPGVMVHLSPEFTAAQLQGITIHPENALQFDFLINKGDQVLEDSQKSEEYKKLVKYFLASLSIPDEDQWVNLSPYEHDRIIKDDFGKTEMGRDLLAEDYMLKQITSSLIYPEDGLGKKFWDRVYQRAWREYHTTSIPVNTFNKVWIVPDQATVYENGNSAYILKSHLKVMLEEDYLSLQRHSGIKNAHTIGSQVIREIILPELEKEINEDKNFANLRQMYSGMVLATWYKKALKESLLGKVYMDRAKVKGIDQDPRSNQAIYQRYLKAFKKGAFNYIKEDVDKYSHEEIPRKYFSGGFHRDLAMAGRNGDVEVIKDLAMLPLEERKEDAAVLASSIKNLDDIEVMFNGVNAAMVTKLNDHVTHLIEFAGEGISIQSNDEKYKIFWHQGSWYINTGYEKLGPLTELVEYGRLPNSKVMPDGFIFKVQLMKIGVGAIEIQKVKGSKNKVVLTYDAVVGQNPATVRAHSRYINYLSAALVIAGVALFYKPTVHKIYIENQVRIELPGTPGTGINKKNNDAGAAKRGKSHEYIQGPEKTAEDQLSVPVPQELEKGAEPVSPENRINVILELLDYSNDRDTQDISDLGKNLANMPNQDFDRFLNIAIKIRPYVSSDLNYYIQFLLDLTREGRFKELDQVLIESGSKWEDIHVFFQNAYRYGNVAYNSVYQNILNFPQIWKELKASDSLLFDSEGNRKGANRARIASRINELGDQGALQFSKGEPDSGLKEKTESIRKLLLYELSAFYSERFIDKESYSRLMLKIILQTRVEVDTELQLAKTAANSSFIFEPTFKEFTDRSKLIQATTHEIRHNVFDKLRLNSVSAEFVASINARKFLGGGVQDIGKLDIKNFNKDDDDGHSAAILQGQEIQNYLTATLGVFNPDAFDVVLWQISRLKELPSQVVAEQRNNEVMDNFTKLCVARYLVMAKVLSEENSALLMQQSTPYHAFDVTLEGMRASRYITTQEDLGSIFNDKLTLDKAMTNKGGIDFNSANFNLVVKHGGKGLKLPLTQDWAMFSQVQGFIPTIMAIKPATAMPFLSELQQKLRQ